MATTQKVFDAKSPGFIQSILVALFTITGLAGIEYPQPPADIADDIVTTFTSTGIYGILGILAVSIVAPIYNFIRKKQPLTWTNVWSSTVTWVALGGVLVSALMFVNLQIPADAPANIVSSVQAKNWSLLGSYLVLNIVIPVVRWIRELRNKKQATAGA